MSDAALWLYHRLPAPARSAAASLRRYYLRRWLPPAPHVVRAHERDDRHVGHDLAEPGDRARAVRARGGPAAPLVRSVARRPLCAHRGTARHADGPAASAVLGLERRAEPVV